MWMSREPGASHYAKESNERWCSQMGKLVDDRQATRRSLVMSKLAEIEKAAETLPTGGKQELLLFLAARLRAEGASLPKPRQFSREQIEGWISEDEADLRRW